MKNKILIWYYFTLTISHWYMIKISTFHCVPKLRHKQFVQFSIATGVVFHHDLVIFPIQKYFKSLPSSKSCWYPMKNQQFVLENFSIQLAVALILVNVTQIKICLVWEHNEKEAPSPEIWSSWMNANRAIHTCSFTLHSQMRLNPIHMGYRTKCEQVSTDFA